MEVIIISVIRCTLTVLTYTLSESWMYTRAPQMQYSLNYAYDVSLRFLRMTRPYSQFSALKCEFMGVCETLSLCHPDPELSSLLGTLPRRLKDASDSFPVHTQRKHPNLTLVYISIAS